MDVPTPDLHFLMDGKSVAGSRHSLSGRGVASTTNFGGKACGMIVELTDSESEDDELVIVGSEKKAESDGSAAKVSAMMAQFASEDGEGSRNEDAKRGNAAISDSPSFLSLDPAPVLEAPLSQKSRRPAKVISYSDDDSDGSDEGMSFIQRIAAQLKASNETLGLVDPPSPIPKPRQEQGSSSRAGPSGRAELGKVGEGDSDDGIELGKRGRGASSGEGGSSREQSSPAGKRAKKGGGISAEERARLKEENEALKRQQREKKEREKLEEKERKAALREQQRAAKEEGKRQEKEAKALQRQTSKSVRGKDSEKEITVLLDHGMAGPDAGMRLVTSRLNTDYNVEEEKLRVDQSMQWRRMVHREDDGGPGKVSKVEVAPIVWVYLTPERLVSLSTEGKLTSFVRDAKLAHPPPSRVTLVVANLRGYLKGLRAKKSEARSAVDDALAHILVFEGVGCRLEENEVEAATAACRATRAVAEEPYRKKPTTAQRHLDDRKGKTQVLSSNAFARMLCSFPSIGDDASQSVTAVYPTVASLMRKYLDPSMGHEEKVGLLADITSGARGKRLGPKASEKIFNILTSRDPAMTVSRLVK